MTDTNALVVLRSPIYVGMTMGSHSSVWPAERFCRALDRIRIQSISAKST